MTGLRKIAFVRLQRFVFGVFKLMVCCCMRDNVSQKVPPDDPEEQLKTPLGTPSAVPPQHQGTGKSKNTSPDKDAGNNSDNHPSSPAKKSAKSLECHSSRGTSNDTPTPVEESPQPPATESSNKTIDFLENYTMNSLLGAGGFGKTYLVSNKTSGEIGVAKIPIRGNGFQSEIEVLAALNHPNIVNLIDVATHGDVRIIVTEYCDGGTLDNAVEKHSKVTFQDWGSRVTAYCQQLIKAVGFMHSNNFVHLDLKTENVVLSADHKTVKLIDFGLSRTTTKVYGRTIRGLRGTPWYMAPEMIDTDQHPYSGGKVDVWALGCVFYELCTGQVPYFKEEANALNRDGLLHYYFACCKYGRPTLIKLPSTFSRRQERSLKLIIWAMLDPNPVVRIDIWKLGKVSFQ